MTGANGRRLGARESCQGAVGPSETETARHTQPGRHPSIWTADTLGYRGPVAARPLTFHEKPGNQILI